ncbi:MAG: integration host factor subunit beta [Thermodesulfovibrionales bacterium]|nr:integration host factor subunit beta [Thermodesulfovibrionales bacterium]
MTKSVLINLISEKTIGLTRKQAETVVDTIFEGMKEALARNEKIEIRGFGNFKVKHRKPKIARNPRTGEKVEVTAKRAIHFKVGKPFHDALNPKNKDES